MRRLSSIAIASAALLFTSPVQADYASPQTPVSVYENSAYTYVTASVTGFEQATASSADYYGYISCNNNPQINGQSATSSCVVSGGSRAFYCYNAFSALPALNEFAVVNMTIRRSDGACVALSVQHYTRGNAT